MALAFWTWLWGPMGGFLSSPLLIVALILKEHLMPVDSPQLAAGLTVRELPVQRNVCSIRHFNHLNIRELLMSSYRRRIRNEKSDGQSDL